MAALLTVNTFKHREFRRTTHIDGLNDHEMLERYRFSNNGVDFIVHLLKDHLERATRRSHALTPRQQVLLALRFFATGPMT